MVRNQNQRYNGCTGALFFDDGGRRGDYTANQTSTAIFCPSISTDKMEMNFSSMNLGPGDTLSVYDGDSSSAPLLLTITGNTVPPLFRASAANTSGCLTFVFTSNGSGNGAGWAAQRGCFNPCQAISPVVLTTPPISPDGILRVCQDQQIDFNGTANFSMDGTGATYEWDLDDGAGIRSGQNVTTRYPIEGVYFVQFIVTDATGCQDREEIDLVVQVSTDPEFNSVPADTDICLGETTTITGDAMSTQFQVQVAPPVAGTTFLPDGSGVSYNTCINVDLFPPNSVVTNATDLISVLINMEHSWVNDLEITLTSPNGQSVTILPNPNAGGGRFFGIPIDPGPGPGTGFDYVITEQPGTNDTIEQWLQNNTATTVPAGNYLPQQPFSNFIGSPLNGQWCLTINDNLLADDGYIFRWELNFNPNILPSEFTFEPQVNTTRWLPDPTIVATNGETITVQPTTTGQVCYTYEFSDDFGCVYTEDVCINVNPGVSGSNPPDDLLVCDLTGTTTEVDLTQNDPVILAALNPADYDINYYTTIADAAAGINPINNPANFTFTRPSQTIFSVITELATGCDLIDDFEVGLIEFSPFVIGDLSQCGALDDFDLEAYIRTFLPPDLNTANFTLLVFPSLADAQASTNQIVSPDQYDQAIGIQEIGIRIEAASDPACNVVESFTIDLTPLSGSGSGNDLELCDDLNEDGVEIFDLTQNDIPLYGNLDPSQHEVLYFITQADADANANPITTPATFPNTSNPQTIFVRVQDSNNPNCFATSSFDITVLGIPQIAVPSNLSICDYPVNDGIEVFDLTQVEPEVLNALNPADYNIAYFLTLNDALAKVNPLTPNYTNTNPTEDIFVCVEDLNTGCINIVQFQINVEPIPDLGVPSDLERCSNDSTALAIFDLTENTSNIIDGQSAVTVSYFESMADAEADSNQIPTPDSYTALSDPQTIYYRISFDGTPCFNVGTFELRTVLPPTINTPVDQEACDDGAGNASIDLRSLDANISAGIATLTITYHTTFADAEGGTNPLPDNYTFTNDETVFVRAVDTANACEAITSFGLIFNELPALGTPNDLILNDDPSGDGVEVFDLTSNDTDILNGLNPADFTFTYYLDPTDAQNASNAVGPNYQNITSPETISVRVENNATGCFSTVDFDLIINPIPNAITGSDLVECDDNGDTIATFQLNQNANELRDGQANVIINYYRTRSDAENQVNPLNDTAYDNISNPQTIYYTIAFPDTGAFAIGTFNIRTIGAPSVIMLQDYEDCDSGDGTVEVDLLQFIDDITDNEPDVTVSYYLNDDDALDQINEVSTPFTYDSDTVLFVRVDSDITDCVNFTTLNLILNPLPEAQLFNRFQLCIGPNDELLQGPVDLATGLDDTLFDFQWSLEGQELVGETGATLSATAPGSYQVQITNSMTGCVSTANTQVDAIGLPELYDISVTTENYDKTHNIEVTIGSPGKFIFRLDDGPYVDSGFFANVSPGPHTVTIREESGCGEIIENIFVYGYPDFFTPNGDGFNDRWNIVGGSQFPNTQLYIFDRYGRLVKQISADGPGWDGTSAGQPLPSSDYWFRIEYDNNGQTAEATGHFALKR
jgi:gliding motility-associated-like protein